MAGRGQPPIDLTNQRFGKLIAVRRLDRKKSTSGYRWLCRCDCGCETIVTVGRLRSGNTKSCGCFHRDTVRENMTTHGATLYKRYNPTYKSWQSMHLRCRYPSAAHYDCYGGRGITICKRWMSFENFLIDMGERPPAHSLDRINNDGNYEPNNCRWATRSTQMKNRRPFRFWKNAKPSLLHSV